MFSNLKLVVAGSKIHLYEYQNSIQYGYKKGKILALPPNEEKPEKKETDSHNYRSKKAVRLLVQSNLPSTTGIQPGHNPVQFLTLTFALPVTEKAGALHELKKYIQRLNWEWSDKIPEGLKYLAVSEIQKKREIKTGFAVWHFHLILFNCPRGAYDMIQIHWQDNGYVKAKKVENYNHLVNYFAKYFTKQNDHKKGERKYHCSRQLNRPWEFRDEQVLQEFKKTLPEPKFKQQYPTKSWDGKQNQVTYSVYDATPENMEILEKIKNVI